MRRMKYLEAGDALRGWGVLLVVVGHCGSTALLVSALNGDPAELALRQQTQDLGFERLFDSRQVGALVLATQLIVYLFFALSAYLLSRPFIAAMFGESSRTPDVRTYARHRLGRVVPLFWAFLLLTIVLFGTDGTRTVDMVAIFLFGQTWTAAPFNQHILQAWTLNVEMAFYIALPVLATASAWLYARGGRFAGWRALVPIAVLAVLAYAFANTWLPETTPRSQSVIGGLLTFLPGILIAVADVRWGDRIGRLRGAPVAAVLLILFGVALAYKQSSLVEGGSVGERNLITLAAGATLAGFVLWQLSGRPTWKAMLWPFPRWVGERSFSIYLMHGVALYQLQTVGADQDTVGKQFLVLAAAAIPVSMVYGAILYELVEKPATRWARRERPLLGSAPVHRIGKRAPTIGTTPPPSMVTSLPLTGSGTPPETVQATVAAEDGTPVAAGVPGGTGDAVPGDRSGAPGAARDGATGGGGTDR